MKKYITLFFSLLILMILSTACTKNGLRKGMEEIRPCNELYLNPDNVLEEYTGEIGILREVTLWLPPRDTSGTQKTDGTAETVETRLWVILIVDRPDEMLWACNLPEARQVQNNRVAFSGQLLRYHPQAPAAEGIIPISISEITFGGEVIDPC